MRMEKTDTDALDRADMVRLAAGHDAALNDLMERHAAPVFHFLCRMLNNEDDANDLAQETFVRVFRAREALRRQVAASCGTCAEHGCIACTCTTDDPGAKKRGCGH